MARYTSQPLLVFRVHHKACIFHQSACSLLSSFASGTKLRGGEIIPDQTYKGVWLEVSPPAWVSDQSNSVLLHWDDSWEKGQIWSLSSHPGTPGQPSSGAQDDGFHQCCTEFEVYCIRYRNTILNEVANLQVLQCWCIFRSQPSCNLERCARGSVNYMLPVINATTTHIWDVWDGSRDSDEPQHTTGAFPCTTLPSLPPGERSPDCLHSAHNGLHSWSTWLIVQLVNLINQKQPYQLDKWLVITPFASHAVPLFLSVTLGHAVIIICRTLADNTQLYRRWEEGDGNIRTGVVATIWAFCSSK